MTYFLKIPNVGEIIWRMGDLCERKTYIIWNNKLYSTGYGSTLIGTDRRQLAVSELEQITQYFRAQSSETPSENRAPISQTMEIALANPRITAELLPVHFSLVSSNSAAPSNEGPRSNRQQRDQKTKDPPAEKVGAKKPLRKYLIDNARVERTFREFVYNSKTGQANTDPNSHRTQRRAARRKEKRKGEGGKAPDESRRKKAR